MGSDLQGAAASFIKLYDWDWWCTLTFRGNPAPDHAESCFRRWIHKLNRRTFGKSYYKRGQGLRWVRGTEHQQRETLHYHVLLAGTPTPTCAEAEWFWAHLAGDAEVEPYNPELDGAAYMVKEYAIKGNMDLGGTWPQILSQPSGVVFKPVQ